MLPICLMPTRRPAAALMGMGQHEFFDLYVGDAIAGDGMHDPDVAVIRGFDDYVEERSRALIPEWLHREASADVVSCFVALLGDEAALDAALERVSGWLRGFGGRIGIIQAGRAMQAVEREFEETGMAFAAAVEGEEVEYEETETGCRIMVRTDDDGLALAAAHQRAMERLQEMSDDHSLAILLGDVAVICTLLADRIRVVVDMPEAGEIDMGGHHFDGDEDADGDPVTPPLVVA